MAVETKPKRTTKKAAAPAAKAKAAPSPNGASAPAGGRSLEGKVAIVTGASRGIGASIARVLGAEGCGVVVNYRGSKGAAEQVAADVEALGGSALIVQADVGDEGQCQTLVGDAIGTMGHVDFLVNNAGVLEDIWFAKMDRLKFDRIINTNLSSVFSMMKAVLPHMEARKYGRIVNMSSIVGQMGNITQANYAAAKAGMIGLSKVVALEYATKGITVNAICPGFIATEMVVNLNEKIQRMILDKIPMGRFGTPEEIAKGVLYLVRDADYMTGTSLSINGGMLTAY
jgi:NAD(P)-dependent dehydrogenase (short-subunit alcohol dehydrogenase family)